jgi:hypothetical protein
MKDVSFGLYLRENKVIVVPSAWGRDIDPVMIVEPVDAEVQQAIEKAIELSGNTPAPPEYAPKDWPVLKALGLKSARAFYENVAHVGVLIYEGNIQVDPMDPTKKGQAFEQVQKSISVPDIKSLGPAALKALKEARPMKSKS